MSKIVLDDLPSGFNRSRIDSNFTKIEQEFQDKVLYRDNPTGEPNQMENDLDMNSNDVMNARSIGSELLYVNGVQVIPTEATGLVDAPDPLGKSGQAMFTDGTLPYWSKATRQFSSVAEMVADTKLEIGSVVLTTGYYDAGDGGGNLYEIVAASTDTADGGSFIDLSGVLGQARGLFQDRVVKAEQFGVTTSTSPSFNTAALQAVIDYSSSNLLKSFIGTSLTIASFIQIKSNTNLELGNQVTLKVQDGVDSQVLAQGAVSGMSNVRITGGTLDGNQQSAPRAGAYSALDFGVCSDIRLERVSTKNASGYGFSFQARPQAAVSAHLQGIAERVVIRDCHALNNGIGAASGGDTFDGYDIKYAENCSIESCTATGNYDKGFDIRGDRIYMSHCYSVSNLVSGFGFSASFSDTGHPVKGSIFASNLQADNNGTSGFYFSEGVAANTVRYSFSGSNLQSKDSGTQGFRVEAPNADIIVNGLEVRGTGSHGVYVTGTSVNSLNISQLLVRDCASNGIVTDPGSTAPISFSDIDVIADAYGAAVYSPEAVLFTGGRLSGTANGPIRVDGGSATPKLVGIVDGDLTDKSTTVVANTSSTLDIKLGRDQVVASSTVTMNNIDVAVEGRKVTVVSSGGITFSNSSQMVLKSSPITVPDGVAISFERIGGKWREI